MNEISVDDGLKVNGSISILIKDGDLVHSLSIPILDSSGERVPIALPFIRI